MKKIEVAYEIFMFILVIISFFIAFAEKNSFSLYIFIIWSLFVVDYSTRLLNAEDKWAFIKSHPFELIAIIPLDALFRAAWFARIFRLLRLLGIGSRFLKPVYRIFKTNGLDKILIFSLIMVFLIPIPVVFVEPEINTIADGLWWAIVTMTTVGYGDFSPATGLGRLLAVVLMLTGLGIIGIFTSAVTSYFSKAPEHTHNKQVLQILQKIEETDSITEEDAALIKIYMERKSSKVDNDSKEDSF